MMTTFQHIDQAVDGLEMAALAYADARRMADLNAWPSYYLDRIALIQRATANLRAQMLREIANTNQQELEFSSMEEVHAAV